MGVLIDSSILIGWERRGAEAGDFVVGREDEAGFLSVVTVSELLHGVHRADDSPRRARRSAFVEVILDRLAVLPLDLPTARVHAELWAELVRRGTPVGAHDLWIAAAAVARGLTLVTANAREFERVPGLVVEVR